MEATLQGVVRGLRKRLGITQQEWADRSDVSRETIALIETGERDQPTPGVLRKLAHGAAKEPLTGTVNEEIAEVLYGELMQAADYLPHVRRDGHDEGPDSQSSLNSHKEMGRIKPLGVQSRAMVAV